MMDRKAEDHSPFTILLLGKNGQVGWELHRTLSPLGEVIATDRQTLDITDFDRLRETVGSLKPQVIVNATAYTAVDKAEDEPELAMRINGEAPGVLAEEAKKCGALLVHYSTDYVFDGTKTEPYTEEDTPNPLNVYGRTKLAGEEAIQMVNGNYLIFRTSWVYGERGHNFYLTIRRLAKEKEEISVVDDQIGAPTWCRTIAENMAFILAQGVNREEGYHAYYERRKGLYHMTAAGQTSWYEFAKRIVETVPPEERRLKRILPIKTKDYAYKAQRPLNSVMANNKAYAFYKVLQQNCFWLIQQQSNCIIYEEGK
jgi:dTDP-4-dehydrorhamnose reductase